MKKICFVKWILDGADGALNVATKVAKELSDEYEFHLISILTNDRSVFFDNGEFIYKNLIEGKPKGTKILLPAIFRLRRYFLENKIDIALSLGVSANAVVIGATRFSKTKAVMCEHLNSKIIDTPEINYEALGFSKFIEIQREWGAKLADHTIVLTNEDRKSYIDKYGLNERKVTTIYNWIDTQIISDYNKKSKSIVTVGRMNVQKGYNYLFEIARVILSNHKDWKWFIYGSGNDEIICDLNQKIQEYGLENQLILAGLEKNLTNIYADKSFYVMTSLFEGLPLVLLEAKQFALPEIAFKCPTGPGEIIKQDLNGFLIDNYDVDSMVDHIELLISDEQMRQSFAEHALDGTEKFEKAKIIKQWRDLFESLI